MCGCHWTAAHFDLPYNNIIIITITLTWLAAAGIFAPMHYDISMLHRCVDAITLHGNLCTVADMFITLSTVIYIYCRIYFTYLLLRGIALHAELS